MRSLIVLLGLLGVAAFAQTDDEITVTAPASTRTVSREMQPIDIRATPVLLDPRDSARTQVGQLRYLGGLHLTSSEQRFGGISGMRLTGEAKLLAVTDGGQWLWLDLEEDGDKLTGVASAAMAQIRGPQREPLRGKAYADAEAMELSRDGIAVAFERDHRLWTYKDINDGARTRPFPDDRWVRTLPANAGIEAMARIGPDSWLYLAESTTMEGRQEGLLTTTRGINRTYAPVTVPTAPGFRPTDAQALGRENVILLSRRYTPIAREIVRIDIVGVDTDRMSLGPVRHVAQIGAPLTIDNMEAIAIRRAGARTFVYLASDDNFSPLQRTLLMKFELLP